VREGKKEKRVKPLALSFSSMYKTAFILGVEPRRGKRKKPIFSTWIN